MYIKKTEKKLLKRLEKIEKVCPITNDRELLMALEKITDDEIASEKPDICLIDEAVNFSLYINGCEGEKTAEEAKLRCYEKIRESKMVSFAKKRLSSIMKIAIAASVIMVLSIGAFAGAISFDIVDMDLFTFRSLEKDKVYEDGKHTVVISDDMFVYYDSIDEMMEGEGLESILLPNCKIKDIRANTAYYTAELSKRHIYILVEDNIQIRIRKNTNDITENKNTKRIGNYDVLFIASSGFLNGIFVSADNEYAIMSSSASEEKISEIIKDLKEYKR